MKFSIFYSPKNDHLEELMKYFENFTTPYFEIEAFKNHQEMEEALIKDKTAYVGVEFPDYYKVSLNQFKKYLKPCRVES